MKNLTTSSVISTPLKSERRSSTYYLPGDLKAQIGHFIEHYNHHRCQGSLENLTPGDVYFGRGRGVLEERRGFRIGHLGVFNDLLLMAQLLSVEMGFAVTGVSHAKGGAQAAMDYLAGNA